MSGRLLLALLVAVSLGTAAAVAVLVGPGAGNQGGDPGADRLAALHHKQSEEREERALMAPGGPPGRTYKDAPYDSANTDGRAGSGSRAVAYRAGQRQVDDPATVAAAPEARLWRTGYGSWEPTIGINRSGTIFFSARNTNADPGVAISDDGGRTWRRSKPPEHTSSLDPYIWVDEQTGRLFASDIDPPVTCTPVSRSDDDGKTWRYSRACGVADHQNHFGGPAPAGGEKPTGYPNVLYYCAISGGALAGSSTISACLKSLDGGAVWSPTGDPAYPPRQDPEETFCDGPVGHGTVGPNGYVYVPRGWCGPPTIAISKDEGATWTRRQVSDKLMPNATHEAGVAADPAGNLYYVFVATDHRAYLTVSRDSGNTWSEERDVTPPGVNYVSAFAAHVDAGATGRIALVFTGSADSKPSDESRWAAYMVSSHDALADDPLFYAAPANDPQRDTLWKGLCEDVRCGNLGDFLDVEIGPDGSVWTALVDSCLGPNEDCIKDTTITTPRGEGVVGQLVGGRPLVGTEAEQRPRIRLPASRHTRPARSCRGRRVFPIGLGQPQRGRLAEVSVFVNGKRVKLLRGDQIRGRVYIRAPRGRYRVKVVAVTTTGVRATAARSYRRCPSRGR